MTRTTRLGMSESSFTECRLGSPALSEAQAGSPCTPSCCRDCSARPLHWGNGRRAATGARTEAASMMACSGTETSSFPGRNCRGLRKEGIEHSPESQREDSAQKESSQ